MDAERCQKCWRELWQFNTTKKLSEHPPEPNKCNYTDCGDCLKIQLSAAQAENAKLAAKVEELRGLLKWCHWMRWYDKCAIPPFGLGFGEAWRKIAQAIGEK